MALVSMTGFGSADGEYGGYRWTWELRSVNGRGLDVRCRLPSDAAELEQPIRNAVRERTSRGNLQVGLQMSRTAGETAIRINESALGLVLKKSRELEQEHGLPPPNPEGLLTIRGVVEPVESVENEAERSARFGAMMTSFGEALAELVAAREAEGNHLAEVIGRQLDSIDELVGSAVDAAAASLEAAKERLRGQVDRLLASAGELSEDRLMQELALLATKADVTEEIDRIRGHLSAARQLLERDEPVGRRFDFLTQEFNREANTLCSKAADAALTQIGLDMKVAIDQMREQVQNVE